MTLSKPGPAGSADDLRRALESQRYLHSLGITNWQDAGSNRRGGGRLPRGSATSGGLTARVVGGLWWERERGPEQIDELVERRDRARRPLPRRPA